MTRTILIFFALLIAVPQVRAQEHRTPNDRVVDMYLGILDCTSDEPAIHPGRFTAHVPPAVADGEPPPPPPPRKYILLSAIGLGHRELRDVWKEPAQEDAGGEKPKSPAPYAAHYLVHRSGRIYRLLNEENTVRVSDDKRLHKVDSDCIVVLYDLGPNDGEPRPADPWNLPGEYAQKRFDERTRMLNASAALVAYLCSKYDIPVEFRSPFRRTERAAPGSNDGDYVRDPRAAYTLAETINYVFGVGSLLTMTHLFGGDPMLGPVGPGGLINGGIIPMNTFNLLRNSDSSPRYWYGPDGEPVGGAPPGAFPELRFMSKVRGYWWSYEWARDFGGHGFGGGVDAFLGVKVPKPAYVRDANPPIQLKSECEASGDAHAKIYLLGGEYEVGRLEARALFNVIFGNYDVHGYVTLGSGRISKRWALFPPQSGVLENESINDDIAFRKDLCSGEAGFSEPYKLFPDIKKTLCFAGIPIVISIEGGGVVRGGLAWGLTAAAAPGYGFPFNTLADGGGLGDFGAEARLEIYGGKAGYISVSGAIGFHFLGIGIELGITVRGELLSVEVRAGPRAVFRLFDQNTGIFSPFRASLRAFYIFRPLRVTLSAYVEISFLFFSKRFEVTLIDHSEPVEIRDLNRGHLCTYEDILRDEEADRVVILKPAQLLRPKHAETFVWPKLVKDFDWYGSGHNANVNPSAPENQRYPLALSFENTFFVEKPGPAGPVTLYELPLTSATNPLGPNGPHGNGGLPNTFLTLSNSKDTHLVWGVKTRITYQERIEGGGLMTDSKTTSARGYFTHAPPNIAVADNTDWEAQENRVVLTFPDYDADKTYEIRRTGTDGSEQFFLISSNGTDTVTWTDTALQPDEQYSYRVRTTQEVTVTVYDEWGRPVVKTLTVNGLWTSVATIATHPAKPVALQAVNAVNGSSRDLVHLYWQAGRRYSAWQDPRGPDYLPAPALGTARMDATILSSFHGNTQWTLGGKSSMTGAGGATNVDAITQGSYDHHLVFNSIPGGDTQLAWAEASPAAVAMFQLDAKNEIRESAFVAGRWRGGSPALMICRDLGKSSYYGYPDARWEPSTIRSTIYPMATGGHSGCGLLRPARWYDSLDVKLPVAALFVGGRDVYGDLTPRPLTLVRYDHALDQQIAVLSTRQIAIQNAPLVSFYNDGTQFPRLAAGSYALIVGGNVLNNGVETPVHTVVGVRVPDPLEATPEQLDEEISIAPLPRARSGHTATAYQSTPPDGNFPLTWTHPYNRIVVIGGASEEPRTEIYDIATNTWSFGPPLLQNRRDHRAALLEDGRILIAGGVALPGGYAEPGTILSWCEIYDPFAAESSNGTIHFADPMKQKTTRHAMSSGNASGLILVAGGTDGEKTLGHMQLYLPARFDIARTIARPDGTSETKNPFVTVFGMSTVDDLEKLPDGSVVSYVIQTHGIYGQMGFPSEPVSIVKGLRGPTSLSADPETVTDHSVTLSAEVEAHSIPATVGNVDYVLERIITSKDGASLIASGVDLTLTGAFMRPGAESILIPVNPMLPIDAGTLPEGTDLPFRLWARVVMNGTTYFSAPTNTLNVTTRPAAARYAFAARDPQLDWAEVTWEDSSAHETGYLIERSDTGALVGQTRYVSRQSGESGGGDDPKLVVRGLSIGSEVSLRVRPYVRTEPGRPAAKEIVVGDSKEWRLDGAPIDAIALPLPPQSAFARDDWERISGKYTLCWRMVGPCGDPASAVPAAAMLPRERIRSAGFFEFSSSGYRLATTLKPGRGYWVKTLPGALWQAEGTRATAPVTLPFESEGWKLVANPFDYPIAWQNSYAPTRAAGPFVYREKGYEKLDDGEVLRKFEGFWIKLSSPGAITYP